MSKDFSRVPQCVLYVCCGSKCKKRGGKKLYKHLKSAVREQSLKKQMQVIKTGCTDRCKHGPVIALMPQNEWFLHVDEEKAMSILNKAGSAVKAL